MIQWYKYILLTHRVNQIAALLMRNCLLKSLFFNKKQDLFRLPFPTGIKSLYKWCNANKGGLPWSFVLRLHSWSLLSKRFHNAACKSKQILAFVTTCLQWLILVSFTTFSINLFSSCRVHHKGIMKKKSFTWDTKTTLVKKGESLKKCWVSALRRSQRKYYFRKFLLQWNTGTLAANESLSLPFHNSASSS